MMYGANGWGWMALMPLVWVALVGLIVWAVIRLTQNQTGMSKSWPADESAREILDRRFASGEIDAEAYRSIRDNLTGRGPR